MDVVPQPKSSWAQRKHALVDSLWALMLPVIILGGLRTGLFTPTEAAVVAAVYSLVVSLFVYREVKFAELVKLLVDAARTTSTVMFLCAGALVSSYMVTLADLPSQVVDLLAPLMGDPRVLMGAVMLLLLAVGTVMDLTPTILVMGPVLMPIALKAGIDPTYFGVMFVLVGTLGLIHAAGLHRAQRGVRRGQNFARKRDPRHLALPAHLHPADHPVHCIPRDHHHSDDLVPLTTTTTGDTMKMKNIIKSLFVLSAFAGIAASSVAADYQPRIIRFGYGLADDSNQGRAARFFAEDLAKRTGGKFKMKGFANASLGSDRKCRTP
jgi:hypothetical protein